MSLCASEGRGKTNRFPWKEIVFGLLRLRRPHKAGPSLVCRRTEEERVGNASGRPAAHTHTHTHTRAHTHTDTDTLEGIRSHRWVGGGGVGMGTGGEGGIPAVHPITHCLNDTHCERVNIYSLVRDKLGRRCPCSLSLPLAPSLSLSLSFQVCPFASTWGAWRLAIKRGFLGVFC